MAIRGPTPRNRIRTLATATMVGLLLAGSLTTAAPAAGGATGRVACSGRSVKSPSLLARRADRLKPCWSALPNANFDPMIVSHHLIIGRWQPCRGIQSALIALDTATGARVWQTTRLSAGGQFGPIGAGSGMLVLSAGVASTVGVDVRTGVVKWTARGMSPFADGPTVAVLLAKSARSLYLVVRARKTGRELWRRRIAGFVSANASLHAVLVSDERGTTTAYDARTGARRWAARFGPASDTLTVRVIRGVVTGVGDHAADTRAYRILGERLLWTSPATPLQGTEPANLSFYVEFPNGDLAALAARTGRVRWRIAVDRNAPATMYAGPRLVLIPERGQYRALNPITGRTLWRVPTTAAGTPPAGDLVQVIGVLPYRSRVFFAVGNCLGA